MSEPAVSDLRDRFRGAMVGAVVGDCLGSPLEFISDRPLKPEVVGKHLDKIRREGGDGRTLHYTDDTAMARQVADSLISQRGFLDQRDLGRRFAEEYLAEPHRGYGRGAVEVLVRLAGVTGVTNEDRSTETHDVTAPAAEQFGGSGSYGNGAAMRAHPVALAAEGREELAEAAKAQAMLTHANKNGYNGAILQTYAMWLALRDPQASNANLVKDLQELVETFDESNYKCNNRDDGDDKDDDDRRPRTFKEALVRLETCLKEKDDKSALDLGNDVTALHSVPSAIFSALRARDPPEGGRNSDESYFERTLRLAFSFGGDTDTIGSMAGSIAGALSGLSNIPQWMVRRCEGTEKAKRQGDELHKIHEERSSSKAKKRKNEDNFA